MSKDVDSRIVCGANWGTVEYAVRSNGSLPAKDDLEKIKKRDSQKHRRLDVLFIKMAQRGPNGLSEGAFDDYGDGVFKFKRHPYRVVCCFIKNRCLLTHVCGKKDSDAYVNIQIRKAKEIMKEHLELEK